MISTFELFLVLLSLSLLLRCTVAEGYNGFHARFSKFAGEIFDCNCNSAYSVVLIYFSIYLNNIQLNTGRITLSKLVEINTD